jgi:hypothetical protein
MSAVPHVPFPTQFPTSAIFEAFAAVKDGAANTPAGRLTLAHTGYDLLGWAFHVTLENEKIIVGSVIDANGLTDEQGYALLEQLTTPEGDSDGAKMAVLCPITPAMALKLAGWLLKAAEIIIPILL